VVHPLIPAAVEELGVTVGHTLAGQDQMTVGQEAELRPALRAHHAGTHETGLEHFHGFHRDLPPRVLPPSPCRACQMRFIAQKESTMGTNAPNRTAACLAVRSVTTNLLHFLRGRYHLSGSFGLLQTRSGGRGSSPPKGQADLLHISLRE